MAIFLPFAASPTFTSFGGIAHCVPESNSVLSISLPSGSLSPTLIVIGNISCRVALGRADDTRPQGVKNETYRGDHTRYLGLRHADAAERRGVPPADPGRVHGQGADLRGGATACGGGENLPGARARV